MQEILVKSLMTDNVSSVSPGEPLATAVEIMANNRCSCILVAEQQHPMGIITERDIVRLMLQAQSDRELLSRPASEFMSAPIITLNQNESLFDALVVSRAEHVRHLPVVDDEDVLVGIVTQSDLANAHFHVIEIQSEIIEKSIVAKTKDLQLANEELQALSMEDHLMEIGNRRAMEVDLEHQHAISIRYKRPYSLILLDIDYFKRYNDHYGHAAGDDALKLAANYFKASIRKSDRLYRYGGEELLLLLPETPAKNALQLAERLVSGLAELQHPHEKSDFGILTTSAGVGCSQANGQFLHSWEKVVEYADKGLYLAKDKSRNRAELIDLSVEDGLEAVGSKLPSDCLEIHLPQA